MKPTSLFLSDDEVLYFIGPPLEEGALPSFFYFSLSGEESLTLDPINQPIATLSAFPMRLFSIDLPGHAPSQNGPSFWADQLVSGHNFIQSFCTKVEKALNFLIHRHAIVEEKIGLGGLSRGAFFATHLGAQISLFNPILGFAPLTRLDHQRDIEKRGLAKNAAPFNLEHLTSSLLSKTLRFYIGNHDTLVGTSHCFHFVQALTQAKFHAGHRMLDVEMILTPSLGNKGHGTAKTTFEEGAKWMARKLGVIDEPT